MHAADWYETFSQLAGASTQGTGPVPSDGFNIWPVGRAKKEKKKKNTIKTYLISDSFPNEITKQSK